MMHLAVALDGAGWHTAAWRSADARPADLLTAGYWTDLIALAESGLLDFVTIDDSLTMQSASPRRLDERTDQVRGRLDAVLIAARIAPTTRQIGIMPTALTTHTEPFHVSKAIATLDFVSTGRAGVQVRVGGSAAETALFGRRNTLDRDAPDYDPAAGQQQTIDRFDEAADYVEVLRRLWDSWQDDAIIRDQSAGRFIDRDRLHYIDFEGRWFSVRGPSITPRPPQGQPIVSALAHVGPAYRLAARQADLVFVTPRTEDDIVAILGEVRDEAAQVDRVEAPNKLLVFADLIVFLDSDAEAARSRKEQLDDFDGRPLVSDARIFTGTPAQLADELVHLHESGYDGFRLRPGALPHDLRTISSLLVPELQRRGVFRDRYATSTLRGQLGLGRPANRYQTA
jgi:alkanesulfonate monooxygenase SsuD/methylene tetrahydromethanopterin reductase-like flavin-dependent oxidoreductase (luciferase family)